MEEGFKEIFERDDIRYHLRLKELKWRDFYIKAASFKYASFYQNYALNWMYHASIFRQVNKHYHITLLEFELLMALTHIAMRWNMGGLTGITTARTQYLFEMKAPALNKRTAILKKKGYISRATRKTMYKPHYRMLRDLKIPGETMFRIEDAAYSVMHLYNAEMGKHIQKLPKDNPALFKDVVSTLDKVIELRLDLAGTDKFMKAELDKALIRRKDEIEGKGQSSY
jgi:hypothetical protein